MIERIAIIPARGGSVRIPRKNLKSFFGKPVIAYSIETALASKLFEQVVVSTDDDEIAEVSEKHGAKALFRPPGWDALGTQEVAARAIEQLCTPESVPLHACVIYATCPMMTVDDLYAGFHAIRAHQPLYAFGVGAEPLRDAACFYWGLGWAFMKREPLIGPRTAMVPIPENRVCDVNEPADWDRALTMYAALHTPASA